MHPSVLERKCHEQTEQLPRHHSHIGPYRPDLLEHSSCFVTPHRLTCGVFVIDTNGIQGSIRKRPRLSHLERGTCCLLINNDDGCFFVHARLSFFGRITIKVSFLFAPDQGSTCRSKSSRVWALSSLVTEGFVLGVTRDSKCKHHHILITSHIRGGRDWRFRAQSFRAKASSLTWITRNTEREHDKFKSSIHT